MLETHAPTWCLRFPAVFGTADTQERLKRLTEGATSERMLREFGAALGALATRMPVLLRLEDLHWADPSSVDALRLLCQRVQDERVLVIGTFRPDHMEVENGPLKALKREVHARNQCEEIALGHLSEEHLQEYLGAVLVPNDFPAGLAQLVAQKTEGNPLFATRVIEALVERNAIVRRSGRWSLTLPLPELEIEVPESVSGMIQKKLERLGDDDRKTLQYASIEGNEFTSALLTALLDVDEMALEDRLLCLTRTHRLLEALPEETLPGGRLSARYRFAHVLYQNILYEQITGRRRNSLHLRAGAGLIALYKDDSRRVASRIAWHFEHGHDFVRAAQYWIHAGNNATRLYTHAQAQACYSRAFRVLAGVDASDGRLRSHLLHDQPGWAEVPASEFNQVAASLIGLIEHAKGQEDRALEGAAVDALSHLFLYASSRLGEAETRSLAGLGVAADSAHEGVQLLALAHLASNRMALGHIAEGEQMLRTLIPRARALGLTTALQVGLGLLGIPHFVRTEYDLAAQCFMEALDLRMNLDEHFSTVAGLQMLGKSKLDLGLISEGQATLYAGLKRAQESGYQGGILRLSASLEWIHAELGAPPPFLSSHRGAPSEGEERAAGAHVSERDIASANCALLEVETNSVLSFGPAFPRSLASEKIQVARGSLEAWIESSGSWFWYAKLQLQAANGQQELVRGDFASAEQRALALLEMAAQNKARKFMAIAQRQIAEAKAQQGDFRGAETELRSALEVLRDHPAPLVTWKLHAGLGRLYCQLGEVEQSRQSYAQATNVVQIISANIGDERLRTSFMDSALAREVCAPGRPE
jgi:tetratricopeptide (TPR) repeat protein